MLILVGCTQASLAGNRIALLIGNKSYPTSIGPLNNPHNDVALVAAALKEVGFDTGQPLLDAKAGEIKGRVVDFVESLKAAGPNAVGVFYYVGHGLASSDDTPSNFILPIDMERVDNRALKSQAVKLKEITDLLHEATRGGAIVFVVFDACRTLAGRRGSSGFVPIQALGGMHIAFSTQEGAPASDGLETSNNGPFALALSRNLRLPGDYQKMYNRVKDEVIKITNEEQRPLYIEDIVNTSFSFLEDTRIAEALEAVKATQAPLELQSFIRTYRETTFAAKAEAYLDELRNKAIEAAKRWLIEKKRIDGEVGTEAFTASPANYKSEASGGALKIVWQIVYGTHIIYVAPNDFAVLGHTDPLEAAAAAEPVPGVAGAVFLEVRETTKKEMGSGGRLVVDERNGFYDPTISRESESAFLTLRAAIEFMRVRLGHGDYIRTNSALFSSLKIYVVDGIDNAYYCSTKSYDCPEVFSFVIGKKYTKSIDVLGHELSHHFLLKDAQLIYSGESGAVLEAFADLFGTLFEYFYQHDRGNWSLGEEIPGFSVANPLRSLERPNLIDAAGNPGFNKTLPYKADGNRGQPDHYSQLVTPSDAICESLLVNDNGCLHINTGILGKAFYLMTAGGEHYKTKVKGIGFRKVERIAYRTVMTHLEATSGLVDSAEAMVLSCRELAGDKKFEVTDADCDEVRQALMAVGLYKSIYIPYLGLRIGIGGQSKPSGGAN